MKAPFVNPIGPSAGPISHALVVSNVAPRYAPAGQHLVAACSVGAPGKDAGAELESEVRAQLGQVFRTDTTLVATGQPARQLQRLAGRAPAPDPGPRGRPR